MTGLSLYVDRFSDVVLIPASERHLSVVVGGGGGGRRADVNAVGRRNVLDNTLERSASGYGPAIHYDPKHEAFGPKRTTRRRLISSHVGIQVVYIRLMVARRRTDDKRMDRPPRTSQRYAVR